jgi:predicted MFS family arabinose efflux permease
LVSGHYGAFTFVSPILQDISGLDAQLIGPLLLAFGVAGIAGNFVAGYAVGHNVRGAIIAISVVLALTMAVFPLLGGSPVGGATLVILWGAAFGGLPVSVQTWILTAAPTATEAATSLNTSMFNLAIALGALVGSVVVDMVTVSGVLWIAAGLVGLTSLAVRGTPRP